MVTDPDLAFLDGLRKRIMLLKLDADEAIARIVAKIKAEVYPRGTLCDLGWELRELENAFNELRKDCKARKELAGKVLALRVTEAFLEDPMSEAAQTPIRGQLASGTPVVKQIPALPKARSPEYAQLCNALGIRDALAIELGIVDFRWSAVNEYVTRLTEESSPLPDGITKTYPQYSTTFLTRKGRTLDDGHEEN